MEFTIDLALVERILAAEGPLARREIAMHGGIAAARAAALRQDERMARAPDADTLACHSGCAWCCNFLVDVRPAEVFNILDFMQREFTAQQLADVQTRIAANHAALAPLDDDQRMQRNIPCAFLVDGRCTIYAARPQTCRNYHATDAAGCKQSFEDPTNLEIDPQFAPLVYQAGNVHVEAFSQAMSDSGYDTAVYEFNGALVAALTDPLGSRMRFETKLPAFPSMRASQVEYQFIDGADADD